MKKISIIFITMLLAMVFISCTIEEKGKYSSASKKDIVASFGNTGRYAIVKGVYSSSEPFWILKDMKNNETIDLVDNYKEVKPYVYTMGKNGYIKLNYKSGNFTKSSDFKSTDAPGMKSLNIFSDKDKKIFEELKSEEQPKKQ